MILVVDCEDSFVDTLARYVREAGHQVVLRAHDRLSAQDAAALNPAGVILSPGPYRPSAAPLSLALPHALPQTPMLGVCLGHLAIAEAYGGRTVRAERPVHGQASMVRHDAEGLFAELPSPFAAGRYHALIAEIAGAPLRPLAYAEDDGALMALRHQTRPHYGVQFHPESVLTPRGRKLVANFLDGCG